MTFPIKIIEHIALFCDITTFSTIASCTKLKHLNKMESYIITTEKTFPIDSDIIKCNNDEIEYIVWC